MSRILLMHHLPVISKSTESEALLLIMLSCTTWRLSIFLGLYFADFVLVPSPRLSSAIDPQSLPSPSPPSQYARHVRRSTRGEGEILGQVQ